MTYSLLIIRNYGKVEYQNDILTWPDVTKFLRYKTPVDTISITIFKFSSNNRILGQKYVNIGNIVKVATSLTDKEVLV